MPKKVAACLGHALKAQQSQTAVLPHYVGFTRRETEVSLALSNLPCSLRVLLEDRRKLQETGQHLVKQLI